MRFSKLRIFAISGCAAAIMAGCSGSRPGSQFVPLANAAAARGAVTRSWMRPDAKGGNLLYVSEYGGGVVDAFTYPAGKLVGQIGGFVNPQGECVDKKGDVFVVNVNINHGNSSIVEFAHGGTTPIATLSDGYEQEPYACAIDRKTDTLAVTNESGAVAIYKHARGSPSFVTDPRIVLMLWAGYDNQSNLYVDGLTRTISNAIDELPNGASSFTDLKLSRTIGFPGNIQWDGKELTLGDALYQSNDTSAIYQLQIAGSTATITGTTVLAGSVEVFGSWIQGKRVIGPEEGRSDDAVDYWKYPAGGSPTKSLSKGGSGFFNGPFGAAISPG